MNIIRNNKNNASLVKRIESLIGQYNKLAAERNMASMPYPSYGNVEVISKSILRKDLSTMKDAVEKIEEITPEKIIRDVEFNDKDEWGYDIYENGIWRYTLVTDSISVDYIGDETELNLTYDDMPFERIYTKDGPKDGYPVTSYSGLFDYARSSTLTSITITGWTNSNVKTIGSMFYGCTNLTELNLSNFNTSQVDTMNATFHSCSSLTKLNLSSLDTSHVIDMTNMFAGSSKLTELNLSSFNTSNVASMANMFGGCSLLEELNISNWDTSAVVSTGDMFIGCDALKLIIAKKANIEKIESAIKEGITVQTK